jgi:hypothetical protein
MRIERVERLNLAFSAGAVAAAFALVSPAFAGGVAAGAVLEAVNFRGMFLAGRRLFAGHVHGWTAGWSLRFLLLAVGIGVSLWAGAHPVGLVIGLSLILPAAVIEAWRSRPAVIEDAPALPPDDPSWERWDPWLARERPDDPEDAW